MAQDLYDRVISYIDQLNLTRSDPSSTSHYDQLGNKMHDILDKLKMIQLKLAADAHSVDQPHNKVFVIGVEGAGKSTTINALLRAVAKSDEDLAAANGEVTSTSQVFHKLYPLEDEPVVDEPAIQAADEKLKKHVFDEESNHGARMA